MTTIFSCFKPSSTTEASPSAARPAELSLDSISSLSSSSDGTASDGESPTAKLEKNSSARNSLREAMVSFGNKSKRALEIYNNMDMNIPDPAIGPERIM